MKRILWTLACLTLLPRAAAAQPSIPAWRVVIGTDARTIASNGGGTAATLTLLPKTSHVAITCNDPDGCAITMGETGLPGGTIAGLVASFTVTITNVSANAVTLADSAGVQELQSSISLAQWASTTCTYETDRWSCGGGGGGAGTVTTTGSPASGNLAKFSGASSITNADLTGAVTTSGGVATTLTNDIVGNANLRNSGALSVIGRSANSSGDPADISASAASGAVLRESGSTLGFGTLATAGIADGAVTLPKIVDASAATRILCRGSSAGSGDWEECTLGTAMSMAGTVISSTATGTGGGDVVGPSSSTDEAVARFDSTTGKLLQNTSTLTLSDAGAFTFADGVKQTFNPNGTNAGVNVGSQAGDPSSPANGDLWYDSTANTLDARINGATVSLGAGSTSGLVLVEQHTASASASLDFTTCISATYDAYQIELVNVLPATDATTLWMRVSTDGGSTYDSGSNYRWRHISQAGGETTTGSNGDTEIELTRAVVDATATTYGVVGTLKLFSPGSTSLRKMVTGQLFVLQDGAGTPPFEMSLSMGSYDSTTAVNAFQIRMASGNITSGSIRCYGLAK